MKVTETIHAVKHRFKVAVGQGIYVDRFVYSYVLLGKKVCLIDTGVAGTAAQLETYSKKLGRSMEEVSLVLLTHAHPDHIGGCLALRKNSPASFGAHAAEKGWIEDVERQYRERPILNFFELVAGSVRVDKVLKEGDVIEWDQGKTLEVLETPGHSPGSVSFYFREEGALFSGDVIPAPDTLPIYVNPGECIESIKKLQKIAGVKYLLSSWHDVLTGDAIPCAMEEGIRYIERIDEIMVDLEKAMGSASLEELSLRALERLGIKATRVLSMVMTSLGSHLHKK
jgi:glyoxylase-like metal-dependent hydrolase (beta-lactamase superfamily II)